MAGRTRSVLRFSRLGLVVLLPILGLSIAGCQRNEGAATAAPTVVAQPQPRSFPVPVVELRGTGDAMGRQYAQALGGEVKLLHDKYLMAWFKDQGRRFLALTASVAFEQQLEPAHRAEIHSLANGLHIDERETMLGNCFLDLIPMTACSTVALPADASPDGVARFGRNLDFPSLDIADKHSVLLIYHPEGRYAFAAVSWPGLIGVLSGMNEHGLALANMEVGRGSRFPAALPYTMLYRTLLERCRTVDEAIALLQQTPRQTANNLMLVDATGDRAVAEITPDAVVVRRADAHSALVSTNHHRGLHADGDQFEPGRCRRYDLLHKTAAEKFGDIDEHGVERLLQSVAGRMTLQAMVFEPANRVIYLATGTDAAHRVFQRLELGPRFAR
jgi:predicted choloylglycine hydrolase